MRKIGLIVAATTVAMLGAAGSAGAAGVVNGDFETGDLSGWTVDSTTGSGSGYWFAYAGTVAPLTGAALSSTVAAPPQGTYAALADQVNPGRRILYQDVALDQVAPGGTLTLSLYAYYTAQQGALGNPSPDSLDPTSGTNEQYRIDVMKPTAALSSIDPADVLVNVFRTRTGDPQDLDPTRLTADLTPYAGQTVRLRFAEVDNAGVLNASTDDVSIVATEPPPDPDPVVPAKPRIQFSPPTRDRDNGTATLPVTVSEAGSLEIRGAGIATATVRANAAGTFDVPVTPVNPLKSRLVRTRKGKAFVTVVLTTADGRTATDDRRVHLRNKRG